MNHLLNGFLTTPCDRRPVEHELGRLPRKAGSRGERNAQGAFSRSVDCWVRPAHRPLEAARFLSISPTLTLLLAGLLGARSRGCNERGSPAPENRPTALRIGSSVGRACPGSRGTSRQRFCRGFAGGWLSEAGLDRGETQRNLTVVRVLIVGPERIELSTLGLKVPCSACLSYGPDCIETAGVLCREGLGQTGWSSRSSLGSSKAMA